LPQKVRDGSSEVLSIFSAKINKLVTGEEFNGVMENKAQELHAKQEVLENKTENMRLEVQKQTASTEKMQNTTEKALQKTEKMHHDLQMQTNNTQKFIEVSIFLIDISYENLTSMCFLFLLSFLPSSRMCGRSIHYEHS